MRGSDRYCDSEATSQTGCALLNGHQYAISQRYGDDMARIVGSKIERIEVGRFDL